MIRVYLDIDKTYNDSIISLSKQNKIEYLEKVIDENQNILSKSGNLISKLKKLETMEIIKAAQREIRDILNPKI